MQPNDSCEPETSEISNILNAVNAETPGAESRLLDLVYSELRRIAAAHLRKENSARRKHRLKRGGDRLAIDLDVDQLLAFTNTTSEELLALDEALKTLEQEDPQLVRLVELRYFNGHTIQETTEILGISVRTVNRSWQYAKARLWTMLDGGRRRRETPFNSRGSQSRGSYGRWCRNWLLDLCGGRRRSRVW